MTKNTNSLNVNIVTVREGKEKTVAFTYNKREEKEKPMALDVLMQAQSAVIPDLAFRMDVEQEIVGYVLLILMIDLELRVELE